MRASAPPPVKLEKPKVPRAPFPSQDPEIIERIKRRQEMAANRSGRRSTMLSDNTKTMTGLG